MKVHENTIKLLASLELGEVTTVRKVAASGLMGSRDASDAVSYGVRREVLERVDDAQNGPGKYRLTGKSLPVLKVPKTDCSFAPLLSVWGISQPVVESTRFPSRRFSLSD